MLTEPQYKVLKKVRAKSSGAAFLSQEEFYRICREAGLTARGIKGQNGLLDLFDKLGIVIHFPKIPFMTEFVLNPRWLTYGVYQIMYSETARKRRGRISLNDVIKILKDKTIADNVGNELSFSAEKCGFIVDAMEQFALCFRVPGDQNKMIIPALLAPDKPACAFEEANALGFRFKFPTFLPRHIISTLAVERHSEIVDDVVWQNGAWLRARAEPFRAEALFFADYHERAIYVYANGRDASRYFASIHINILNILNRMADLEYREEILLLPSACISNQKQRDGRSSWASFRQILVFETLGQPQFPAENGELYSVPQILRIMSSGDRDKYRQSINIVNYGKVSISSEGDRGRTFADEVYINVDARSGEVSRLLGEFVAVANKKAKDDIGKDAIDELRRLKRSVENIGSATEIEASQTLQKLHELYSGIKTRAGRGAEMIKNIAATGKDVEWLFNKGIGLANLIGHLLS